jgi:hypothetical protein
MNRRLIFLSGHLSGLLLGAALAWMCFSNTSTTNSVVNAMPRNSVVIPVSYPTYSRVPDLDSLPNGWELHHFNGQSYFIIPVEKQVIRERI